MNTQSMKYWLYLTILCFTSAGLTSCLEDTCTSKRTFVQYDPVYIPESDIRPGIQVTDARPLADPGNISVYKNFLLVNERRAGVHILDNSDPSNPVNLAFIEIPGNLDMAVKNDILYADLYLDLVAIDISLPQQAKLIGRTDGVFASYYPLVEDAGYIVEYVATERTIEVDCNDGRWGTAFWRNDDALFVSTAEVNGMSTDQSLSEATGINGSMSRFTLSSGHLYALDDHRMRVFGIEDAMMPELINTVEVDWGIETLFPYENHLFIGANAGMFILDNSDPTHPVLISEFVHAESCDPVFVTDDIAYVTLRSGTPCRGFVNQLEVIDVSDLHDPRLIRIYEMDNPHGLSVVNETLYLCEGAHGMKVFSVEDNQRIDQNMLDHVTDIHGFDVIALNGGNHLILVGMDGIYQFNATDKNNIQQISVIAVDRI